MFCRWGWSSWLPSSPKTCCPIGTTRYDTLWIIWAMIYDILIQPDDWAQAWENLSSEHIQLFACFWNILWFTLVSRSSSHWIIIIISIIIFIIISSQRGTEGESVVFKHTDFFVIGKFDSGYHPVLNIRCRLFQNYLMTFLKYQIDYIEFISSHPSRAKQKKNIIHSHQCDAVEHKRLCPLDLAQALCQLSSDSSKCLLQVNIFV